MKNQKKYLVTPALPYANGPCHLGHLLEQIQANIFVRALRMDNCEVLYVCGADSHGTPIEMNALKASLSPLEFTQMWQRSFDSSLKLYLINFDGGFGTTHSKENEEHAGKIYLALKKNGHIKREQIEQLYDPVLKRFLADRMLLGECPNCKAKDQYGDSCEICGKTYTPSELINPKSVLSGATPVIKSSEHLLVKLSDFTERLKEWVNSFDTLQSDTKGFLKAWFLEGLKDWDISRDGPYFGFLIPGEENKYFYVWLDAPVGYISLSEKAALEKGKTFKDYWLDKDVKIIHFIGKDIVYFHTLFWPAMLMAAEYNLPKQIVVHGMLNINGEKMSKSRGTFILADTFAKHVNPEALRYYFACKLMRRTEDIDLNLHDFIERVNTDLVNKIVNLISRTLPLINNHFSGHPVDIENKELVEKAKKLSENVRDYYLKNEPSRAINDIVRFSEEGNRYLQENAPWKLIKSDPKLAQSVLCTGLYIGKVSLALLKPVLPNIVTKLEEMLNGSKSFDFDNIYKPFEHSQKFQEYTHLFNRIEESSIKAIIEESREKVIAKQVKTIKEESMINIEQFMAVDLRAALVKEAKEVEGSDKLIECLLNVGELGERTVFTGLRPYIQPKDILGKTVVLVANLAPRKMRFGTSHGMILAAGEDNNPKPLMLENVAPGSKVR